MAINKRIKSDRGGDSHQSNYRKKGKSESIARYIEPRIYILLASLGHHWIQLIRLVCGFLFFLLLPFIWPAHNWKNSLGCNDDHLFFSLGHVPPPPRQRYLICKATDRYRQAQKEPSTYIFSSFSLSLLPPPSFWRFKKSRRRDAAAGGEKKSRQRKTRRRRRRRQRNIKGVPVSLSAAVIYISYSKRASSSAPVTRKKETGMCVEKWRDDR